MQATILREIKPKVHETKQKSIKITLKSIENVETLFQKFLRTKRSYGAVEVTLTTYTTHFKACSRYFDTQKTIDSPVQTYFCKEIFDRLRRQCVHASKAIGA